MSERLAVAYATNYLADSAPRRESALLPVPLQQVDGCPDDDPHHVDEVPVDPGDLDAVVVVG
jgi:hypothetical protein